MAVRQNLKPKKRKKRKNQLVKRKNTNGRVEEVA